MKRLLTSLLAALVVVGAGGEARASDDTMTKRDAALLNPTTLMQEVTLRESHCNPQQTVGQFNTAGGVAPGGSPRMYWDSCYSNRMVF